MKKLTIAGLIALTFCLMSVQLSAQNVYTQRFLDLRAKMNDPVNGYFSKDGVPYHSVETLIAEAPDHGHETTSEAYSYWIWMEAMYGGISGDWAPLNNAWTVMEEKAIPTSEMQPTTGSYDPSNPADFAAEHSLPDYYPSKLESDVPVGEDPVSPDLTATYGSEIYAMHWLFDCDNFYGYGNLGDGISTPSYINTFQRGEQESVWETVPHPSWEDFSWGDPAKGGFLGIFVDDPKPTKQWRYTNAPDADTRAVQAMYWATQFAKEQGKDPKAILPLAKASKMGDFIRLAMFDKYFKPLGVQDKMGPGGKGYESAHYLMSWYFAWGGPLTTQGWAWRIGSSHNHFGYQNPMAAYALSEVEELKPVSANGVRDWGKSLERQLEFYTWLQSAEGAIAGGATNCYAGDYSAYPAGTATFYDMAYTEHPVYHDPGSNQWIGMQAWSMERIAELYYISNNPTAKKLMDNWVAWLKSEVKLLPDGGFEIPATLKWSGQPEIWDPANPKPNTGLHVTVTEYGQDLGIAGCLAKALIYYAAGTQAHATLDDDARELAKQILDRMWDKYYEPTGLGVATVETRGDFTRFFEQEVFLPTGYNGKMANGDIVKPGVKFIDIRSEYKKDKDFPKLEAAYKAGEDYKSKYHRYWAQADIALANAEYGRLFGETKKVTGVEVTPKTASVVVSESTTLTATVLPFNAANKKVTWSSSDIAVAKVDATGKVTGVALGTATISATTQEGSFTDSSIITVTSVPYYTLSVNVAGNGSVDISPLANNYISGSKVTLTATAGANFEFIGWDGDLTGTDNPAIVTMDANKVITARFKEIPAGCQNPGLISLPYNHSGAGEFCWITTGDIANVNSWNLDKLEINGKDLTNIWSSEIPAKIDGKYLIHYVASVDWAGLEIGGSAGNTPTTYKLTSTVVGQGTITPSTGVYDEGTNVSLTATPATGWEFVAWSGDATGASATTSVKMDADKTVTATFKNSIGGQLFNLTVGNVGSGSVSLDPAGGKYTAGTIVKLTASPLTGYKFDSWSGDATGTALTTSVIINTDKAVTATFMKENTGSCDFGTPIATPLSSINSTFKNVHILGSGPSLSNIKDLSINWDLANNGLWQLSLNTNDGNPNWYVDLKANQTNTFDMAQPTILLSGTGITGLDGDYYVALDAGNLVLDEKTGAYTVYFSNSSTSPCTKGAIDMKYKSSLTEEIRAYPNPAEEHIWLEGKSEITRVSLYSAQGALISSENLNVLSHKLDLTGIEAGAYFIKIESNNQASIKTFIIR